VCIRFITESRAYDFAGSDGGERFITKSRRHGFIIEDAVDR
jgi:hypothetical protein